MRLQDKIGTSVVLVVLALVTYSELVLAPQLGPASAAIDREYHVGYLRGIIAGVAVTSLLFSVRPRRSHPKDGASTGEGSR
ncbi:MAG TPA: hypothetical protein VD997_08880 [Phycisphaerales bacterium]|nr:hypothetical protein [Phycisphaerales bacterium]